MDIMKLNILYKTIKRFLVHIDLFDYETWSSACYYISEIKELRAF